MTGKLYQARLNGALLRDRSVTGLKVALTTLTGSNLVDETITTAKIGPSAINGSLVQNRTLEGSDLVLQTITNAEILDSTITGSDIADATIPGTKIGASAINNAHLQGGIVSTDKIAAGAITAQGATSPTPTSTTSTAQVLIPGSGVNLTTASGSFVFVTFIGIFYLSAPGLIAVAAVSQDGANTGEYSYFQTTAANYYFSLAGSILLAPAAGAHAFGVTWRTTGGTLSMAGLRVSAIEFKK